MVLKGGVPDHEGDDLPDRWSLNPGLEEIAGPLGDRPGRRAPDDDGRMSDSTTTRRRVTIPRPRIHAATESII